MLSILLIKRSLLLTDDKEDISRNFIVSKELETYKNIDDLLDKYVYEENV